MYNMYINDFSYNELTLSWYTIIIIIIIKYYIL